MTQTFGVMGMALSMNILSMVLAGFSMWGVARILDRLTGLDFKKALETMKNDPRAISTYYGYRLLALAIVAGWQFS